MARDPTGQGDQSGREGKSGLPGEAWLWEAVRGCTDAPCHAALLSPMCAMASCSLQISWALASPGCSAPCKRGSKLVPVGLRAHSAGGWPLSLSISLFIPLHCAGFPDSSRGCIRILSIVQTSCPARSPLPPPLHFSCLDVAGKASDMQTSGEDVLRAVTARSFSCTG